MNTFLIVLFVIWALGVLFFAYCTFVHQPNGEDNVVNETYKSFSEIGTMPDSVLRAILVFFSVIMVLFWFVIVIPPICIQLKKNTLSIYSRFKKD